MKPEFIDYVKDLNRDKIVVLGSFYEANGYHVLIRNGDKTLTKKTNLKYLQPSQGKAINVKIRNLYILNPFVTSVDRVLPRELVYLVTGLKEPVKVFTELFLGTVNRENYIQENNAIQQHFYQALIIPELAEQQEDFQKILLELESNDINLKVVIRKDAIFGQSYLCKCSGKLHLEIILSRIEEMGAKSLLLFTLPDYRITWVDGYRFDSELKRSNIKCVEEEYFVGDLVYPLKYLSKIRNERSNFSHFCDTSNTTISGESVFSRVRLSSSFFLDNFHQLLESMHGEVDFVLRETDAERISYDIVDIACNDQPLNFQIVMKRDQIKTLQSILEGISKGIKRGQVLINLQAKVGERTVVSHKIKPYRKDVTKKCYGGDKTRKQKLLSKQKAGKKNRREETVIRFDRNLFRKR